MTDDHDSDTGSTGQGDPDGLGDAGKRAIRAERDRADKAERDLRTLQSRYDTANQRVTQLETDMQTLNGNLADRDLAITRLHVGIDKGLPRQLIDRLQGADEAALTADADQLITLIPAPTTTGGSAPRPDPSQGARSGGAGSPEQEFAAMWGRLDT